MIHEYRTEGTFTYGGKGTAQEKTDALLAAGITVAEAPALIGQTVAGVRRGGPRVKGGERLA